MHRFLLLFYINRFATSFRLNLDNLQNVVVKRREKLK